MTVVTAPQGGVPFVDEDRTPSNSALIFLQQLRNAVVQGSGGATVSSVGLTLPKQFKVTGSPITNAGTLAGTWNPSAGWVFVTDFGADPTGSSDSTTAIQAAINALPVTGGFVYFPPGIYKISSTLVIGNGSASANSTINGVSLVGIGGMSDPGLTAPNFAGSVILRWAGGSNSMVQFLGPMAGWGIENIVFDGITIAAPSVGLEVKSAANGFCRNVTITNASTAGILSWTWSPISGAVTFADSIQNTYINTYVVVPAVSNAKGIQLDSGLQVAGTPQSDTDYNTFINTDVFMPNSALTTYGVYLKSCDSNCFVNLHLVGVGAGNVGVAFDYSIDNVFPNSNFFFMVDNAMATQWINSAGTPSANPILLNKIFGIAASNGAAYPQLANLATVDPLQIGFNTPNSALGGTVTQLSSITTAVTLNKLSGQITTVSNAFTNGVLVSFTLNNTDIGATDVVIVNSVTTNFIAYAAQVAATSVRIVLQPLASPTTTVQINFVVIKGTIT